MKNMDWWEQGRFGMFIHFGIYAVTEGAWEGEVVPTLVEWMQFRKQIPLERYKQLAEGLTLEKFNAKEYVRLAKAAGMKYVCTTAMPWTGRILTPLEILGIIRRRVRYSDGFWMESARLS